MADRFNCYAFVSHNSQDKPQALDWRRDHAPQEGRWFDDAAKQGHKIYVAVKRGLEAAPTQALRLSLATLAGSARFAPQLIDLKGILHRRSPSLETGPDWRERKIARQTPLPFRRYLRCFFRSAKLSQF